MSAFLDVDVYGLPAPQGSKRYVGRGVMIESSNKVAPWREAVKAAVFAKGWDAEPMSGPILVRVCFTLPKPASAPKTRRTHPAKRPDIDKLIRSTFDALGDAGVWLDDAQVIRVTATKAFPNEHVDALSVPGARINVEETATVPQSKKKRTPDGDR